MELKYWIDPDYLFDWTEGEFAQKKSSRYKSSPSIFTWEVYAIYEFDI